MAESDSNGVLNREDASRLNPLIGSASLDTMEAVADALNFLSFMQPLQGAELPDSAEAGRMHLMEVMRNALRYEVETA